MERKNRKSGSTIFYLTLTTVQQGTRRKSRSTYVSGFPEDFLMDTYKINARQVIGRKSEHIKSITFRGKTKWLHGVIAEQTGQVPFRVRLDGVTVVRRHVTVVQMMRRRRTRCLRRNCLLDYFSELPPV